MQKTKLIYRTIGIAGLIISAVFIINFSDLVLYITTLGTKYLSSDDYIRPLTILKLKIYIVASILLVITLSVILILNLVRNIHQSIITVFQEDILSDSNICSIKLFDLYICIIGTFLGIIQIFYYFIAFNDASSGITESLSENSIEWFYALLLLLSLIILVISITRINRLHLSPKTRKKLLYYLLAISGILLVIYGEEISWGQRIFGWDSTGVFIEYNYQNETNIHNFLNPLNIFIYPIVGIGSLIVLLFTWFVTKMRKSYLFDLLIPHPSLFFLVFIMAIFSLNGPDELYEEILAIFIFLYSIRIFTCLSFPKIGSISKEK